MTDLNYVIVERKINNESSLVILFHKDGTINRSENGYAVIEKNSFICMIDT
jgi:hypothetical protein